jgi:hypothetical protein
MDILNLSEMTSQEIESYVQTVHNIIEESRLASRRGRRQLIELQQWKLAFKLEVRGEGKEMKEIRGGKNRKSRKRYQCLFLSLLPFLLFIG